ncbi:MAG: metallophosphoesterase [Sedimentisphaerales bacterium]|nr:metallophosphoesterase [Sedimentisphaerales bacterium]
MAEIFFKSMNRRSFIQTGLAAFGTLVTLNSGCGTVLTKSDEKQTNLALLADTHIPQDVENNYRGFYPYRNLEKVVPEIISASPDEVFIAGDLARLTGESGDYANLKKLLSPVAEKTPVFMGLGNHDNRENFLKVFNEIPGEKPAVKGKHITIIEKTPVRLIMLDSLLYTNKVPGLLGKAQRQWLENYLKESDETPTILCFHHTLSDGDGDLLDVPRLFRMIAPIRKVKAIVYGHSHVYGYSEFEGIHLINLPAVGYNFSDSDAVGWVQARLTNRGGDFVLHAVAGNKDRDGGVTKLAWRKG